MMGILNLARAILEVFSLLIFVRVVLSWVNPNPRHEVLLWVIKLTEPVLGPIRAMIPLRGVDLSPIVAWVLIRILVKLIVQAGA
ncbi:MAG: YggT family protein [Candidatus Krumholzibacteria bacterium]|nr:YggT family protein [Candidatus Krumholzibacteria bacterium]